MDQNLNNLGDAFKRKNAELGLGRFLWEGSSCLKLLLDVVLFSVLMILVGLFTQIAVQLVSVIGIYYCSNLELAMLFCSEDDIINSSLRKIQLYTNKESSSSWVCCKDNLALKPTSSWCLFVLLYTLIYIGAVNFS